MPGQSPRRMGGMRGGIGGRRRAAGLASPGEDGKLAATR
jgi:hypothetical protein